MCRAYKDANGGVAAPPSVRGVIGALSAATVLTVTMPLEVVRRRLQVQVRAEGRVRPAVRVKAAGLVARSSCVNILAV